jgi:pentatricopeptide repeat protein
VRQEPGSGSNNDALDPNLNLNRSRIASVHRESSSGSNDGALDPDDPNRNKTSYLEIGRALHSYAIKRGLACKGSLLKNALVSMYGRWGQVAEAENVVYGSSSSESHRDVVSWSAIISIYVGCSEGEKALLSYMQMHREGVDPDRVSCVLALQACACLAKEGEMKAGKALEIGQALQADVEKKGYASDARVATALIGMHGKCGAIPNAERVFNGAFDRDLVAWNAMLSVYVEGSQGEKAMALYREMREAKNVGIDEVTLLCSLRACEDTGCLDACRELHFVATASGWEKLISVAATLIHTYTSCAGILEADMLNDMLAEHDLVSWTALLASHGARSDDSSIFEESKLQGIVPDEVMFTSLLAAFSHAGLVARALGYFESMVREYGITPQLKQYGAVIDLLGRAGDLRRAESLLRNMPIRPDLAILGFLLGACATHGDVQLAKQAFDFALMLEPHRANAYVFMSNMAALHDCAE